MPRSLRIEYPGAIYHAMSRGNNGQDTFVKRGWYIGSPEFMQRLGDHISRREIELLESKSTRLEKQGIAWLLNVHTTATVRWVANRLEFGAAKNASRAINQFRKEENKGMKSLKKKLTEFLK